MKNITFTLITFLYLPILWAQTPTINVGQAQNCTTITSIPFTSENFVAIEGYQFSVNWDADQLTYDNYTNVAGGTLLVFENEPGKLSVLWDNALDPLTAVDGTILFNLTFSASPTACNFNTPLKIADSPISREATINSGTPTSLASTNGSIVACGPALELQLKALLEGPYEASTQLMDDDLRHLSLLPEVEPYTELNLNPLSCNITQNVEISTVFAQTGNDAIVDWVLIELRNAATPTETLSAQSALLQRDGDIVSNDGISPLKFYGMADGNYHIVIRHRNHLGIRTASAVALTSTTPAIIDFSNGTTMANGNSPMKLVNGVYLLWSGDTSSDGNINAIDRSDTWNSRNQYGYNTSDVDLTGTCNAADRTITWNNRNLSAQY